MSYGIMPYRVSLSRLSTRFGNTNNSKRSKIRRICLKDANDVDELDSNPDAPLFKDIVENMLDAKIDHPEYGYKYWYALRGFIESIGQFLMNNHWYPASADVFWKMEAFKLYDIDAPMEIPAPNDFPTVFVLRGENMTDDLIENLKAEIAEEDQFRQTSFWIQESKRYKQDLILFYH